MPILKFKNTEKVSIWLSSWDRFQCSTTGKFSGFLFLLAWSHSVVKPADLSVLQPLLFL